MWLMTRSFTIFIQNMMNGTVDAMARRMKIILAATGSAAVSYVLVSKEIPQKTTAGRMHIIAIPPQMQTAIIILFRFLYIHILL